MIAILFFAIAFAQDAKQEKPLEAKDSLKRMIVDFDKTYRQCVKRYEAGRTTADRQDAANENFLDMNEWIRKQNQTPIQFECAFIDIARSEQHGYFGNFTMPKELVLFIPAAKKPLIANTIGLPVDPDLRESLWKGMKVTVKADILASELATKANGKVVYLDEPIRNKPNAESQYSSNSTLFTISLKATPSFFSRTTEKADYSALIQLENIQIVPDPDDLKKSPSKKSK